MPGIRFSIQYPKRRLTEDGQALLVVVLLFVVILTIGLSLAARSITNVRQSSEEDSSQRAFSAAEAGIEVALSSDSSGDFNGTLSGGTTYSVKRRAVSSTTFVANNGNSITKNTPVDLWLAQYPNYTNPHTGTLTVYWGDPAQTSCSNQAALEIAVLSGTRNNPSLAHYAYDPCTSRGNNFVSSTSVIQNGGTIEGKVYRHRVVLSPQVTNGLLMRIIPLYNNTPIAVRTSGAAFPAQGTVIESTGISGETQRRIVIIKNNPGVPLELFPYALFTPESL